MDCRITTVLNVFKRKKYLKKQIEYIENQLNSRPRKCLNFATPYDVLQTASVALHG